MEKNEGQWTPRERHGVVEHHNDAERMLRERWDDPSAEDQDPLVVVHLRSGANGSAMMWLVATFMMAWERCAMVFAKKASGAASPRLRVLFWGGGDDELPIGHMAAEWANKSVLSIGWWKEWMNDPILASILRCLYGTEQIPGDFDRVLQYVFRWCDHAYRDQQAHNLKLAYDALPKEEAEFVGPDGKTMRVVGLPDSARAFTSVALERGVALLIFREDGGRVVLSWSTSKLDARDTKTVARVVGIEERRAHDRGAGALTFDEVVKIASKVLNPNSWEPGFAFKCKEGICGSGRNGNPICPRAVWRLNRCDGCRFESEASPVRVQLKAPVVAVPIPKSEEGKTPAPTPVMDVAPSP